MFENREEAGRALGRALESYKSENTVVCALLRGGAPIGAAVAAHLDAPLDLVFARKLGAPRQKELAIGAVVDGDEPTVVLHDGVISALQVNEAYIERTKDAALKEIERRRSAYSGCYSPTSLHGRTVILVDDGLATGATMEAAVKAAQKSNAAKVIVAVPVAPSDTLARLRRLADEVVSLETPERFWSVGAYYRAFPQLADEDVMEILRKATPRNEAVAE